MKSKSQAPVGHFNGEDCSVSEFRDIICRSLELGDLTFADKLESNIPLYDIPALEKTLANSSERQQLMAEWANVLGSQSGVMVLKQAYKDTAVLEQATDIFNTIIVDEKTRFGDKADHFAKTGKNDRIWNTQQKLCEHSPDVFARYYANPAIDAACEAWLGPAYQMTAQVNVVYPGGAAQLAHRDYHLGFQTEEQVARYPAHAHQLSAALTLQGAIAHIDMPIESGPTKLLPFSQCYAAGYAAWRRDDFRQCFEENFVQVPLHKGDVVFFNPALFHAAGSNVSKDINRLVNLLQVSSSMGRAMENIDRLSMCKRLFPILSEATTAGTYSTLEMNAIIAASAEGYSFPTNLDRDPPDNGLAPETQSALFQKALTGRWSLEEFTRALTEQLARQQP